MPATAPSRAPLSDERTIEHPVIGDRVTLLETGAETDGERMLARDGKVDARSLPRNPWQLPLLLELAEGDVLGVPVGLRCGVAGVLARIARRRGHARELERSLPARGHAMRRARRLAGALLTTIAVAAAGGAAAAEATPGTLARTAAPGIAPVSPGIAIGHLGVQWRGPAQGAAVRFERHGRWGAWTALHPSELHRPGLRASELVAAGAASRYQLRLPAGARAARATAIDASPAPSRARRASLVHALPDAARGRLADLRRGCLRTRADWGADESLRFDATGAEIWPPAFFPVQRLTVHHTATEGAADGTDPAAVVRAIYRYHAVDLGFGDLGYQLLVDRDGCVYEGRHSGPDGTPVYAGRRPGVAPAAVNGGHTAGFNAGNVGVALIGDHDVAAPTPAALRATVAVLAALARDSALDPRGTGIYVNPISGATREVPMISGHRDWLATACPGGLLYALLPSLRERVAALLPL
jgi:hypothetical protein